MRRTAHGAAVGLALLAVVFAPGCAATRKAYDERIGWMVDGRPPTIRFGCKAKPTTQAVEWAGRKPIPIFIEGLTGGAKRAASELIRWRMGDGAPIAVNVEGPHPQEVLAKDVLDIMLRSGFLLAGGPAVGVLVLTAAVAAVKVNTPPSELRHANGRTTAAVDVALKLAGGGGAQELIFEGARAFGVLSAVRNTPESIVNDAYCTALQGLADTVAKPSFLAAAWNLATGAEATPETAPETAPDTAPESAPLIRP